MQETQVHPGWNAVVPCDMGLFDLQFAMEAGRMDIELQLSSESGRRPVTLGQLAATPSVERFKLVSRLHAMATDALKRSQQRGDAWHQTAMLLTGLQPPLTQTHPPPPPPSGAVQKLGAVAHMPIHTLQDRPTLAVQACLSSAQHDSAFKVSSLFEALCGRLPVIMVISWLAPISAFTQAIRPSECQGSENGLCHRVAQGLC